MTFTERTSLNSRMDCIFDIKLKRKRRWTSLLAGLLLLLLVFSYTSTATAQALGTFIPTGNMTTPRVYHTATLLLNGKVLITGGGRSSAELFDPITGTFTTTGEMTTARSSHSATLLMDGRVLIAGGNYPGSLGTAELYDPATGMFTATGNMSTPQSFHTATLLNNGKVLIAGGVSGSSSSYYCPILAKPELYDPATGTFTATGDYADKNVDPNFGTCGLVNAPATLLPNGKVLIAAEPTAELYYPDTGTFSFTGQMTTQAWYLEGRTANLLTVGKVLLTGGENEDYGYFADAEVYDPSSGKFTAIGKMTRPRDQHTATLLRDGTVLMAGGWYTSVYASAELYNPVTGIFTATPDMTQPRVGHTATLLLDGRILMTGGTNYSDSAELYVPPVLVPAQVVTDLRFDRTSVEAGSSYSVNISGSNLTPQTFFDVRFTATGSNASEVVLNWQRGIALSHDVSLDTAAGNLT